MGKANRLSDIQRIAKAFRFTGQDLRLNREGRLSEAQRRRLWRRYWMVTAITITIFAMPGAFLVFFSRELGVTFTLSPPNISVGDDPLLLFAICAGVWLLFVIFAVLTLSRTLGSALQLLFYAKIQAYHGMITVDDFDDEQYLIAVDNNRSVFLKVNDGSRFSIGSTQYNVLKPFSHHQPFAIYYFCFQWECIILSLEPI